MSIEVSAGLAGVKSGVEMGVGLVERGRAKEVEDEALETESGEERLESERFRFGPIVRLYREDGSENGQRWSVN